MIEEYLFSPTQCLVALLTVGALLALMDIVLMVTSVAACWRFLYADRRSMARMAMYLAVLASEDKAGFFVVEKGLFPIRGGMAGVALLSEAPPMFVMVLVTAVAVLGGLFVSYRYNMAFSAMHLAVLASEDKAGFFVVEKGLFPIRRCMAGAALLSEESSVVVIQLVARETVFWRLLKAHIGVAVLACNLLVLPLQGETRPCVIKASLVDVVPGLLAVAVVAGPAKASFVAVITLVTVHAF